MRLCLKLRQRQAFGIQFLGEAGPGAARPWRVRAEPGLAFFLAFLLAAAAPPPGDLGGVERHRAERLAAGREAAARAEAAAAVQARLGQARAAAAAQLRATEEAAAEAAARVSALAGRRAPAEARLRARAADLAPLLPLIERLSLYPAETLLAAPAAPERALTGLLVVRGLAAELQRQAAALRAEQAEVAALAAGQRDETVHLDAARAAQVGQAAALDREIAGARDAERAAEDAGAQATRDAAADATHASTLREALARIEAERRAAEAMAREDAQRDERERRDAEAEEAHRRQAALARPAGPGLSAAGPQAGASGGALVVPVAGSVVQGWGAATDAGPAVGLSYRPPPGARVVSPCAGRVVFAAPFRSYGRLAIVDCGAGFHAVLSGLGRLDVSPGRAVQRGEPLGVMGEWDPGEAGTAPTLSLELRRGGQPVDPGPFLRGRG